MGIDDIGTVHILSKESISPKIELDLDKCTPGMLMAETVYNHMGAIMILENTELDPATINSLKRLGIDRVKVYQKLENNTSEDMSKRFREVYTRNLAVTKEVFSDIYSGKPLDMAKVEHLSGSVLDIGESDGACLKIKEKLLNFSERLYTHSVNVSMLSYLVAKWLKLGKKQTDSLVKAGVLHDIGKIKTNPVLWNKYEHLAEAESGEVKQHPVLGWEIVRTAGNSDSDLAEAILMHHEKENGRGYPSGIEGEGINILARIINVADMFDNLTSGSNGRKALNPFEAFEAMQAEGFKGNNTGIILKFLENAPNYFIGEKFFLSNGEVGEVIFINSKTLHRPLVKVGEQYVDLAGEKGLKLEGMV